MARKKTIDISKLPADMQAAIQAQLDNDANRATSQEAIRSKAAIEFYYKVKEEIEAELLKKLMKQPSKDAQGKSITIVSPLAKRADGDNGWSGSKILKIIGNMPARKPIKGEGFITAASNVENGKKRKLTPEAKAKRAAAKEAAALEKARKVMFKKEVSDRKKPASSPPNPTSITNKPTEPVSVTGDALIDKKNADARAHRKFK